MHFDNFTSKKRTMANIKILSIMEPHHRRPTSLDGTSSPANISHVDPHMHDCWHYIFGNMNAFQIANRINQMPPTEKPEKLKVVCKFINGSQVKGSGGNTTKNKKLILYAWRKLSKGLSFVEFIGYINNVFLDPSYHLYVEEII